MGLISLDIHYKVIRQDLVRQVLLRPYAYIL